MKSAIAGVLSLALSGCFVDTDDSRPVIVEADSGLLIVDWSISGYQDPALCRQSGADVINVSIQTMRGEFVAEFEDVCEAFETSIELAPDGYFGDALLLDPSGTARTTSVDLGSFEILGNDELVVPIDFPSDSFY
jgi:hypothetical protein